MSEVPKEGTGEKEAKFFGVTMGDFGKALLGFLFAALLAVIVWRANAKEPRLTVTDTDLIQFRGDKNQFGIVNVTVTNDGTKEADEVECRVQVTGTAIDEVKAAPDAIKPKSEVKGDTASVTVPHLNPGETLQVSALCSNVGEGGGKSEVSVRGKGVVGEKQKKKENYPERSAFDKCLSIAELIVSILIARTFYQYWQLKKPNDKGGT